MDWLEGQHVKSSSVPFFQLASFGWGRTPFGKGFTPQNEPTMSTPHHRDQGRWCHNLELFLEGEADFVAIAEGVEAVADEPVHVPEGGS